MEKRVLLAVFLSFLVLFVYQTLFVEPLPPEPSPGSATSGTSPPAPEAPATPSTAPPKLEPEAGQPAPGPVVADEAERDVVVETPNVRATFSSRGAVLRSWILKGFTDGPGKPIDLVPADAPAGASRPFSLRVEDQALTDRLRTALYRPSASRLDLDRTGTLTFEYQDDTGLRARKAFRFSPDTRPYTLEFSASVEQNGNSVIPIVQWGPALGDTQGGETSAYIQQSQAIYSSGGSVSRVPAGEVADEGARQGRFDFIGVDDQYFLSALVPTGPVRVTYEAASAPTGGDTPRPLVAYSVRFEGAPASATFFMGPKDFDVLKTVHPELVRAIHFGIFAFIVVPLLGWLKWINTFVGNYGWAIIILTVLINLVMFPLRHKSVVSMRKMQELQPEVKAIQERYSKLKTTDPARQKMNVELMNLYRERGVNPASGCVPMLLTMPVLFAFYSMLSVAIEIRNAPFMLWITDLSAHDPYYVTPLLMGGTMVWQQLITPTSADPMQQKILMLMPVVFTFMFLSFPSGLVIYWLVSNLLAIGQTYLTNKILGPPRTPRPPAERKLKKAGAGKTEAAG
jgi:YidC/Oxa1 family membrane protein insertase